MRLGSPVFGDQNDPETWAAALRWLAEGHIRVDGLYSIASPRQAQEVYQELLHAPGERLTTLFDWTAIA